MSKKECITAIIRQAQRFHFASQQDANPIIAARHNGYAVALMDAIRDIATEEEVKAVTGISALKLRTEVLAFQDKIEGAALKLLEQLKAKGFKLPGMGESLGFAEAARKFICVFNHSRGMTVFEPTGAERVGVFGADREESEVF
jgi:hypothetical protein